MELRESFGAAIRGLRAEKGKGQEEVARAAGIAPRTLGAAELQMRMSWSTLNSVADALGCDEVEVLERALAVARRRAESR